MINETEWEVIKHKYNNSTLNEQIEFLHKIDDSVGKLLHLQAYVKGNTIPSIKSHFYNGDIIVSEISLSDSSYGPLIETNIKRNYSGRQLKKELDLIYELRAKHGS